MTVAPWIIEAHKSGEWLPTRGAGRLRVICVDASGERPVIVLDALGNPYRYCANGAECDGVCGKYDLIPPRREWEVCVYEVPMAGMVALVDPARVGLDWKLLARAKVREGMYEQST